MLLQQRHKVGFVRETKEGLIACNDEATSSFMASTNINASYRRIYSMKIL